MTRLLAAFGFALRRGAQGVRRRLGATLWATAAVAAALFALGAARLVDRNLVELTRTWQGGVDMIVYLDDDMDNAHALALAHALDQLPAVEHVELVPPTAALGHMRAALGDHAALLDGVEPGLLPASLEVALAPGLEDVAASHPVIARLRATPGVEDVEFLGDWVERADAAVIGLRRAGGTGVAVMAVLALLLTAAVVRLAVVVRRRDAQVLELLGASVIFRRGPTVVHGLATGLTGGALACVALALAYRQVADRVGATLGVALGGGEVAFLPLAELGLLCAVGAIVGAIGGALGGMMAGGGRAPIDV